MSKYFKILFYSLALVGFFAVINYSLAYSIRFENPYDLDRIDTIMNDLACWVNNTGFLLIIIFIVLTGIRMIGAGPKPEKFKEAAQAFKNVLIGGLVILGVGVIISTISYNLGVDWPFFLICS